MIEVINLTPIQNRQLSNTYGYISLGGFEFPKKLKELLYSSIVYYEATCKMGSREFELIIVPGSYLSNQSIILGDLTNIPGNLLVDQEELYHELKERFEELIQDSTNSYQWIMDKDDITVNPTLSILGTPVIQGTTSNLYPESYILKVDYGTES